ncbi:hypothetical protein V6N13_095241 [Hibiscus sabdariffa]
MHAAIFFFGLHALKAIKTGPPDLLARLPTEKDGIKPTHIGNTRPHVFSGRNEMRDMQDSAGYKANMDGQQQHEEKTRGPLAHLHVGESIVLDACSSEQSELRTTSRLHYIAPIW